MKTIVFAGGGTAGHVMPNIALIEQLRHEYNCVYVGGDGMEKSICLSRNVPFFAIDTVKFRRDKPLSVFGVPAKLARCVKSAKSVLDKIKPDLVFSKGGYAALPVVLAAKRITVLSHESDCSPGLATKLAKRKSKLVLCAFERCAKRFENGVFVGTPLMQSLYSGKRDCGAYGLSGDKPVLAIVGGSSGAATLNAAIISALPELLRSFDIIHMTGKNKHGGAKRLGYAPIEFEQDMAKLYATSDIVLTRAGAGALAECIALKIPTVAVPLEKASRGDQKQNAEYYSNIGAVTVLREKDMTTDALCSALETTLAAKHRLIAAMSTIDVDGTSRICRIIRENI